jgi:hypothetical protein
MSTPVSHHPLAPLGSRRLTWLLVAGLAVVGVTLVLVLSLSGSNSPYPVHAVPAAAVGSPAPRAAAKAARYEHGMPSLNPQVEHVTSPKAQGYAPNIALRKEGLIRRP